MSRTVIARRSLLGHVVAAVWGVLTLTVRFVSGLPMDGKRRTDAGLTRPAVHSIGDHVPTWWSTRPILARAGIRLGVVAALAVYLLYRETVNQVLTVAALAALVIGPYVLVKRMKGRRFRALYTLPLAETVAPTIEADLRKYRKWVSIHPDFAGLAKRLIKPMSPAETAVRRWYGTHIEPVVRWLPDRIWKARVKAGEKTGDMLAAFRRPAEEKLPCVEIRSRKHITPDIKKVLSEAVVSKLGLDDLTVAWDQIGSVETGRWTVPLRPPARVSFADIVDAYRGLKESEFVIGLGPRGVPYVVSLDDDSPHIALSAGSGAGKSVFAMIVAAQVIARGGTVVIIDIKGSHKWAHGLTEDDGVIYCTQVPQIHDELIRTAGIAELRNTQSIGVSEEDADTWDPGPRRFVIFEEMNATFDKLGRYYRTNVWQKGDEKTSPAVIAFREIMYMGRSAKVNLLAVAQMLTARTVGGPEARENFAIRALARYTANAWKMLVPQCVRPRMSKEMGRWQIVVGDEATEVQVAYDKPKKIREWVRAERNSVVVPIVPTVAPVVPDPRIPHGTDVPGPDAQSHETAENGADVMDPFAAPISLMDALKQGIVGEGDDDLEAIKRQYERWRKRMRRTREDAENADRAPVPVARMGKSDLFTPASLIEWSMWEEARAATAASDQKKDK